MIKLGKWWKPKRLDEQIDRILLEMENEPSTTENYKKLSENLDRLYKMKEYENKRKVSPDTIVVVLCNLVGIVLILNYEKTDTILSKAMGMLPKGRV